MNRRAPRNPYVGPRAFRTTEELPNRSGVARELTDLVIAERVVLLHAPSGAGKTSLIQAAVSRLLVAEGFHPTPALRVDIPPPAGCAPANRYVFSVAMDLLGADGRAPGDLAEKKLADVLAELPSAEHRVLVLDQFEEILTQDPTDWDEKEEFFRQLGSAVRDGRLWMLVAVREDFMGGLEPYLRFLPGQLRSRFRLDFLKHDEAVSAIQSPAAGQDVTFELEAARYLVGKLADRRVQRPGSEVQTQRWRVVEPFQLQIVCRQLWKEMREVQGDYFTEIRLEHVQNTDIPGAFSRYYAHTMKEFGAKERAVRDWCEDELITIERLRSQTSTLPVPGTAGTAIVDRLKATHLVRSDTRADTTWYELAHDRLVSAVLDQNDVWRRRLPAWQQACYLWQRRDRRSAYLLSAEQLESAPEPTARGLTPSEREFLGRSFENASLGRRSRWLALLPALAVIAVGELVIIVLLLAMR